MSSWQRHGLRSVILISYFYKKYLLKSDVCIFLWKYFSTQIYSYDFHIFKHNNLKVIHDLYSQCLILALSKMIYFRNLVGVVVVEPPNLMSPRSARLPLDTQHPREDTKSSGPIEHSPKENPKIHIFYQDHKWENKTYIIINHFLHHF